MSYIKCNGIFWTKNDTVFSNIARERRFDTFFIGSRCERSGILRWLVSMSVYHLMWVLDLVRLKYDQAVMDGLTFSMTAGHQALYSI